MSKPIASLSLDLDNKWAYMRAHGLRGWQQYPSYLPQVAQRAARFLDLAGVQATVFVVGRDLECDANRDAVCMLAAAGHEIGNHSYSHYPWLDQLDSDVLEQEIADAEIAIELATGQRPRGFRSPGFSGSPQVHEILAHRGYHYDASAFPTCIGPLAAWYARLKSFGNNHAGGRQRFATLRDSLRPLRPYKLTTQAGSLVEVPVTTMPLLRVPIHVTYLMYLGQFSVALARAYMRWAMRLCRLRGIGPSMLLHPLDFLGGNEEPQLAFFPGMSLPHATKQQLLAELMEQMQVAFTVGSVAEHARTAGVATRPVHEPVSFQPQPAAQEMIEG